MTWQNELTKILLDAFLLMLTFIIPVLGKKIYAFVSLRIKGLIETTKNAGEKKILASIDEIVGTVVNYVSQTFVDALKKSGEFSEVNQTAALTMAVEKTKDMLSEEAKEFIMANYGDLNEWITLKIESAIKESKPQ